jgi:hypothetical protein
MAGDVVWDLSGLSNMTPLGAIVLVLAVPYLLMAMGRLVPRQHVKDWKDAYFRSEAARDVERETTSKLLGYAEAADYLLRSALPPPSPRRREDDEVSP